VKINKSPLFLLFFAFYTFADIKGDKIVAVVGDSAILQSDVEAYADMMMQQGGGAGDALLRNLFF